MINDVVRMPSVETDNTPVESPAVLKGFLKLEELDQRQQPKLSQMVFSKQEAGVQAVTLKPLVSELYCQEYQVMDNHNAATVSTLVGSEALSREFNRLFISFAVLGS